MKPSRQTFAELLPADSGADARRRFSAEALRRQFFDASAPAPACGIGPGDQVSRLLDQAPVCLDELRERFASLVASTSRPEDLAAIESKALLEMAPLFIGSQYLLHAFCGNWNNQQRQALTALRIHALDVGCGQPRAGRIDRYEGLLRSRSIASARGGLWNTASDDRVSDGAFVFATALIVLSYFPESFTGEILGINLFLRRCGLLPPFEVLRPANGALRLLDLGAAPEGGMDAPADLAVQAVSEYIAGGGVERVRRVASGLEWARRSTLDHCGKVYGVLVAWTDPREAARQFLHHRRHDASQYHQDTRIDGRSMPELLDDADPAPLLEHLARSPLVRPGEPASSPLLNGLLSYRSKMFRIFSQDEVAVLHRWIDGLPYTTPVAQPAAFQLWPDEHEGQVEQGVSEGRAAHPHTPPRQMYERLLHAELSPSESNYARDYVEKWLGRAAAGVDDGVCPLPAEWQPGTLRRWLRDRHEASNRAHSDAALPSKKAVNADVRALAPLTMIDGAWLSGFAHPALASTYSGYGLFETFFDELGNGIPELNHPLIYRELMRCVCGEVLSNADPGFSASPLFDDRNFDLPVYWLALGKSPLTHMPELMGMNLAMELSGVGGGYRRTSKALASHGYPTLFADLHNSIDNISTGHTAWAADSIDSYMSSVPRGSRSASWRRVRTGFVSLNPPEPKTVVAKLAQKLGLLL